MKAVRITITICFVFLSASSAIAAFRYVPQGYDTIQEAVNACDDFDTVVLEPYTYSGAGNRSIDCNDKKITVRSIDPDNPQVVQGTVIDCEGAAHAFVFMRGEDANTVIAGLTITGGSGMMGGAIFCNNSSPSITKCIIVGNTATYRGGGLASTNGGSHPSITYCRIKENSGRYGGGGVYCGGGAPRIQGCIISGNSTLFRGGAIYSRYAGEPVVANCTISGNAASDSAGGIYCSDGSNLTLSNTILWGNTAPSAKELIAGNSSAVTSVGVSYCDVEDPEHSVGWDSGCTVNWYGENIDGDPCFVDMGYLDPVTKTRVGGDYHLLPVSPCINAGDPTFAAAPGETDIDGNPRVSGASVDIGADEYEEAGIPATIRLSPRTLNHLRSNGRWVTCTIKLPGDYDIGDVDVSTIVLNGQLTPVRTVADRYAGKVIAKFERAELQEMLYGAESPVSLSVRGELGNGTVFEGTDTIRIVR
ncbi:MAG: right-handed parallel beta-helix repeat-containing protein [Planctomycetota bacterium]|jgi:parallel beta-helix repeat protein